VIIIIMIIMIAVVWGFHCHESQAKYEVFFVVDLLIWDFLAKRLIYFLSTIQYSIIRFALRFPYW